jgi:hypothetical protein
LHSSFVLSVLLLSDLLSPLPTWAYKVLKTFSSFFHLPNWTQNRFCLHSLPQFLLTPLPLCLLLLASLPNPYSVSFHFAL